MNLRLVRFLSALLLGVLMVGCQHLDLTPESDAQRVVAGTINVGSEVAFPPDAIAIVRVVDLAPMERAPTAVTNDLVVADVRHDENRVERVLGEQLIRAPGTAPFPFRVEFQADDTMLRRGVNIDVRISQDGKVRYRTLSAHVVTLSSVTFPQDVTVDAVR